MSETRVDLDKLRQKVHPGLGPVAVGDPPKTYRQAMELLVRERIVPREQAAILQQLVKFRNRAVHLYDRIRAEELWSLMRDHLVDFEAFNGVLVRRYFGSGDREGCQ